VAALGVVHQYVGRAGLGPRRAEIATTSTNLNYYTGLKLGSNSHFYGRAAAEEVLAGFQSAILRLAVANGASAPRGRSARAALPLPLPRRMRPWATWTGVVSLSKVGAAARAERAL
jgi:hypothetical protein